LEVGLIWRIQVLDMAYWGFLGVGTTLDIFQNIILIPYLEYVQFIHFPSNLSLTSQPTSHYCSWFDHKFTSILHLLSSLPSELHESA
ncbi:hypothetical protein Tco_1414313, partial [Tanacetum coccineum]